MGITPPPPFLCPLCGSNLCYFVHVDGRSGSPVRMPWYSCAGCSVLFVDSVRFQWLMRRTITPGDPSDRGVGGAPSVQDEPTIAGFKRPLQPWEISHLMPGDD